MAKPDYKLLQNVENEREHSHNYAQILLPVGTGIHIKYKDEEHMIGMRELCFIPPDTLHQCLCENELIVINIPPMLIKKGDLQVFSNKTVIRVDNSMEKLIELIRIETRSYRPGMRYLYYYLYELLVENNAFRSIRYIRENFSEYISVETLAALENYNSTYFIAWFKKHTGCTPAQYIKMYRIEKAKELLMFSAFNVLEIAVQTGYGSHAAFSRAFRSETGCTPIEYRQGVVRD
ncbi:MAG: AraC family transcriptional regulator [Defluviitaleaceae bacterium]|nr:AraC family transcriptional regulator [Defluviitaleaceae bacterium]